MKRLIFPALLVLTAGCADPRANEVSATRANVVDPNCVASVALDGCPPKNPGVVVNAGQSAASIGTSLSRSLMRLF